MVGSDELGSRGHLCPTLLTRAPGISEGQGVGRCGRLVVKQCTCREGGSQREPGHLFDASTPQHLTAPMLQLAPGNKQVLCASRPSASRGRATSMPPHSTPLPSSLCHGQQKLCVSARISLPNLSTPVPWQINKDLFLIHILLTSRTEEIYFSWTYGPITLFHFPENSTFYYSNHKLKLVFS